MGPDVGAGVHWGDEPDLCVLDREVEEYAWVYMGISSLASWAEWVQTRLLKALSVSCIHAP